MRYDLSRLPLAARQLPEVNRAIVRRDAELGQEAAARAFGRGPVRVGTLGKHPQLRPTANGQRP